MSSHAKPAALALSMITMVASGCSRDGLQHASDRPGESQRWVLAGLAPPAVSESFARVRDLEQRAGEAGSDDLWTKAAQLYREIIDAAPSKREVAYARHNLGVILVNLKDYHGAVQQFERLEPSSWELIDESHRSLCRYNAGRAYEGAGNPRRAYLSYKEAAKSHLPAARSVEAAAPAVEAAARAVEAAFRLVDNDRIDNACETTVELCRILLDIGASELANERVHKGLSRCGDEVQGGDMLVLLVECYVLRAITPKEFVLDERPFLRGIVNEYSELRDGIDQIQAAFAQPMSAAEVIADDYWKGPRWRSRTNASRVMSEYLKHLGDVLRAYERDESEPEVRDALGQLGLNMSREVLARYCAAWAMDENNIEAGLYGASMLASDRTSLRDRTIVDWFVDRLNRVGGLDTVRRDPEMLRELGRTHFAIGRIFEQRGEWGSEVEPRTAIGQWARAELAFQNADAKSRHAQPRPGLLLCLGRGREQIGEYTKAAAQYLEATKQYAAGESWSDAKSTLALVQRLKNNLSSEQQAELDKLAKLLAGR